jgi:hypothetical protein
VVLEAEHVVVCVVGTYTSNAAKSLVKFGIFVEELAVAFVCSRDLVFEGDLVVVPSDE